MERILAAIYNEVKNGTDYQAYSDLRDACRKAMETDVPLGLKYLIPLSDRIEEIISTLSSIEEMRNMYALHNSVLLLGAPHNFHMYLLYVESAREPEKKFYVPRRKVLKPLVDDLQDLADGKIDFLGISLPPRVGKLLADDTPVFTLNGWKRHGDLVIGDEVVGEDGKFKRVVHVFPKGFADYEIVFTNGEKLKCHGKHEWKVYNRHRQKWEILETEEMLRQGVESGTPNTRGHRYHFQLPYPRAMLGEEREYPVDPYVLGAWLGDGTTNHPKLTICDSDVGIVYEIMKSMRYSISAVHNQVGCKVYYLKGLRKDLQRLGMCHSRETVRKYIPVEYLKGSMWQRLRLLAGLIDTDGTMIQKNGYIISTVNPILAEDIVCLISSFGWRVSRSVRKPETSSSGIIGKSEVHIIKFYPDIAIPCKVPRKKIKVAAMRRRIAVKSISPIEPVSGNCIQVEDGMYRVGYTMIPTHNSTMGIFFITWIMGKRPDAASVMSGHSDKLTDGFYRELLSILTDPVTYRWADVFPMVRVASTSAKNETIDLDKVKRFPTMTCRSISGTLTGAVEIGTGGILYVDDIIEDLEESLNPLRLQSKYDAYLNQLKDRKKLGALELMVGTRWNVFDPLGRIQQQYGDNDRYRFRAIPALNEDGESNFNYAYGVGFDTAYYMDMKDSIDDATWNAKYMGNPYIREGLLFPEDELKTYNGVLPDGDPEKIAVCDVAWGGGDSTSMPIAYIYGENVYIHDVVFNTGDKTVTYPAVIGRLKQHFPHKARFEANNGGSEYADYVDDKLRKDGIHINIYSKRAPSNQSKLARIIQFAPDVKKFYFLGEKYRSREYRAFMTEVTTFVQTGKNPHDDAVDSLAQLADELYHGIGVVTIIKRPF